MHISQTILAFGVNICYLDVDPVWFIRFCDGRRGSAGGVCAFSGDGGGTISAWYLALRVLGSQNLSQKYTCVLRSYGIDSAYSDFVRVLSPVG
ncbi:hypothetical protein [Candidatus Anaplasma sp. TIGMIC]|uniref:hypothetical protein n=1 Tax=Candidatus Anaplasma sp. TIGMIC TaxID=3020713 RepID=UPI00232CF93F|nr:hypothetical protein [Candidatus Anaplasma sp. TIGMIC]MDB1135516.1 hypothetical protein [Candidatus Anaplasma sp. TIGMIC]